MEVFKNRLTTIGVVAFTFVFVWALWGVFGDLGAEAAAIDGADSAWGFTWAVTNIGWLFVFLLIVFFGYLFIRHRKGNKP